MAIAKEKDDVDEDGMAVFGWHDDPRLHILFSSRKNAWDKLGHGAIQPRAEDPRHAV